MIVTQNLSVSYNGNVKALDNISLQIKGPAIVGIIGPNGAGKSTLMKAMLNLLDYGGQVTVDQKDGRRLGHTIAYVEQRSMIDYNFPITVKECVLLGTYTRLGLFRRVGKKEYDQVDQLLEQVGLAGFGNRPIKSLSGGQFQRMLVARCLIQESDYIFLDEPFVGIDSVSEKIIIDLLKDLKKAGKTILIVHHDLSKVEHYFDELVVLNKELIAYGPVDEVFTVETLSKAYGDHLFLGKGIV
ncbi:TPA: metal ABC transporter ATP-binding protein [Streptococcus equi subsp. zooepidemicus]|uniref:metal ABC transporter ATP-binding protein n=1 Tax=Streptococcus equi TaxID=1336 RepID=UPI0005B71B35|nr:metal ABC transporter ATP-binding protein [Streptococcus equi]KIQ75198.1 manganese ABC transporter ATP-binding protein [Streptococcus equi subsp. zooepidemicus]MCD3423560.1 metal ABC transporter ATP-binding protein [Streptococcus equi subsp. zooepidemicus]MCD3444270.1 metal ABC transporter ATP-binding protein [Streptococcus equi subsp. zooepidemicus]QTZ56525.1 High-affinity zinc uptake system ATP-binding protein ZnuC [Streptococcus equi subsp. zooepidemicus]HEL0026840.1 metal ABC transporte